MGKNGVKGLISLGYLTSNFSTILALSSLFISYEIIIPTNVIFSIFTLTSFIFSITLASIVFLSRNYEEYINQRKKEVNYFESSSQFKNGKNILNMMNVYLEKNSKLLIQLYNLIISLIITLSCSIIIVVGSVYPLSFLFFFVRIPFDFNDILNDNLKIFIKSLAFSSFIYGLLAILIFIINLINGINKDLGETKNWLNGKLKEDVYKETRDQ